jgi:hypothetical protein
MEQEMTTKILLKHIQLLEERIELMEKLLSTDGVEATSKKLFIKESEVLKRKGKYNINNIKRILIKGKNE